MAARRLSSVPLPYLGVTGRAVTAYDLRVSYSREERLALCDLLDTSGPDAPTLCDGWLTRDLAAHLVLRERRPDAAAGVLGGPLAGHTARVQRKLGARLTYEQLVEAFRDGPPRLSAFALPGVDEKVNTVEYFVHHEDVRRARPEWEPREVADGLSQALWGRLKAARFLLRKAPVGVELARDAEDGPYRVTVRNARPTVTVIGPPAELTMWCMGRTEAANVTFDGTESAIATLREWRH
jgi:uncharacterized protein (TIGR03085 family)